MNQLLKTYDSGTRLVYENGRFDKWLVSFYRHERRDSSPSDIDLFELLQGFGDMQVTWALIRNLGDQILKNPGIKFQQLDIETPHGAETEEWVFDALAAMMLAEERKEGSKLGCKVKLIGCYQVLIEGKAPWWAANWSKGKSARKIENTYKDKNLWDTPGQIGFWE